MQNYTWPEALPARERCILLDKASSLLYNRNNNRYHYSFAKEGS